MPLDFKDAPVTTVEELLLAHDERFVRLAYQLVLGRAADPEGLASYLLQIRLGTSKTELIAALSRSAESRSREIPLPGLKSLVARHERRPFRRLRGALARLLSDDGQSVSQRLRALHNDVHRREARLAEQLDATARNLDELAELNRSLLARLLHLGEERVQADAGSHPLFPPADRRQRLVFNLSTAKHWRSRAVGIIRVERELAARLATYSDVVFVFWDREGKSFIRLSAIETKEILSERWCNPAEVVADFAWLRKPCELQESDCFVSVGLDWDLCPLHEIGQTLRESRCEVVMACYDIVPILFPEFCVEDNYDQRFKRHFVDMAHLAARVFTISENSGKDLRRFWESAQIDLVLPPIHALPLASLRAAEKLPRLSDGDADRMRHLRANRPFVLYVSSIEIRKNHRLLINVWKDLYRERGEKCPLLVLVGMRGWGTADLLAQVQRTAAATAGKIVVLSDINDDMLVHLYKHCSFAVFPSYYEGWGLAATEAMALGKACLIADAGGLVEATQNLMPKLHPLDFPGWKLEIQRLLDDPGYRKSLEARIQTRFKPRGWSEVSRDFVAQLIASDVQSPGH